MTQTSASTRPAPKQPVPLRIYTRDGCRYCAAAKSLLGRRSIPHHEIDLSDAPERRAQLMSSTGGQALPQIYEGERHIGGLEQPQAAARQRTLSSGPRVRPIAPAHAA